MAEERRFLKMGQLRERWGGVSHMFIERRMHEDPTFPKPIRLGKSLVRFWAVDEIESYERKSVRGKI
jgi:predicted DNA-binding transcriptional regulator AlpA